MTVMGAKRPGYEGETTRGDITQGEQEYIFAKNC